MTPAPVIDISLNADDLADRVAIWLATRIALGRGPFALCLSGGTTPKKLYELLASEAFSNRIDWSKVQIFYGDERFVPVSSQMSNYRMAREALLDHVALAKEQIHAVPLDAGTPEKAALLYEKSLREFYGAAEFDPQRPLFDVTLLGLGTDGHTASLFPGTDTLNVQNAWVSAVIGVKEEPRVTLTFPALQSSRAIAFLVSGAEKKDILKRMLAGDESLPAARVKCQGKIFVFADRAAVGD